MAPLICPKCNTVITPGTQVILIGSDDFDGQRIYADGDMIVVHETCPDSDTP